MAKESYYSTNDEIAFIDGLGTFTDTTTPRLTLLKRYRKALNRKHYWGAVERGVILNYLDFLIERGKK